MNTDISSDRLTANRSPQQSATDRLRTLMAAADIPSFRALARQAQVSDWAVQQLRRDRITTMRITVLQKLAAALDLSLTELLQQFGAIAAAQSSPPDSQSAAAAALTQQRMTDLEAEYLRLQAQMKRQADELSRQFQQEALAVLESWLLQWPTAVRAVDNNPDLPASRLVPLVQPVQTLLELWNVKAIAPVGDVVPYSPQAHQPMKGEIAAGEPVKIRYAGFRWRGQLLHRAKVSKAES